jgi:surface antigen
MVKSKPMKQRSTTPVSKSLASKGSLVAVAVLMAAATPIAMFSRPVQARDFAAEIQAVQNQIDQYQAQAGQLQAQANTLQNALNELNNQQAVLQAQISANQLKFDKLTADIAANEKKIADSQVALGKTLASLYTGDNISPLEMLASSQNIGDYLDKQTQRSVIRDQLNKTITEIKALKAQLEQQKVDVQHVLDDQAAQKAALAAKQAEQQKLISDTQGQEAAYQALTAQSQATKSSLIQQQQAEIAARLRANSRGGGGASAGDPGKGGYPSNLANSAQDSMVDPWGLYNRECVSYVAWKVYQKNGYMPYGFGNAIMWPGNARGAGIGTGSTPRAGAAGVMSVGAYGHIVWVESVNSDGTINISQYNELLASGWGQYSERYHVNPSTYDTYIYF